MLVERFRKLWDESRAWGNVRLASSHALVACHTGYLITRVDDDGIMSRGDVVRPWHYVPFVEAIETLTCKHGWRIVEKAGSEPRAVRKEGVPLCQQVPLDERRPTAIPPAPPAPFACEVLGQDSAPN